MKKHISPKAKKRFFLSLFSFFIIFIIFLFGLFYFLTSSIFKFKEINVSILNSEKSEKEQEIKDFVQSYLSDKKSFLPQNNFFFLSLNNLRQEIKNNFEDIKSIEFYKSFDRNLYITINFYKPKFVGCITEIEVLIPCMTAEEDGIFLKEVDGPIDGLYYIETSLGSLSYVEGSKKESFDSIAQTKLYDKDKNAILFEFLKYLESESYVINKVVAKDFGIIDIYTDQEIIVFSLEKGFAKSIKEFEFVLKSEPIFSLKQNKSLEKIDFSYKNRVFYTIKSSSTIQKDLATTTEINL
jgi:cell division septal protein FtsQ